MEVNTMSMREVIYDQFSAVYDQNGWFVCFNEAVKGLTEYEVEAKEEQGNTIAELLNHLYFYNARYLSRFQGEEVKQLPSQFNTFLSHEGMNWHDTIQQIQKDFSCFRKAIEGSSDEKLEKWCETLLTICLHNAYHIGQIVHIRKRFGSWSQSPVVKG
jgi:uncharacterized damage-inducible protein DinB